MPIKSEITCRIDIKKNSEIASKAQSSIYLTDDSNNKTSERTSSSLVLSNIRIKEEPKKSDNQINKTLLTENYNNDAEISNYSTNALRTQTIQSNNSSLSSSSSIHTYADCQASLEWEKIQVLTKQLRRVILLDEKIQKINFFNKKKIIL